MYKNEGTKKHSDALGIQCTIFKFRQTSKAMFERKKVGLGEGLEKRNINGAVKKKNIRITKNTSC